MRYETPLFAWGFLGHVLTVGSVPALRALPEPTQVGLVALPTALLLAEFFTGYRERLPGKLGPALATVAGVLYLGMSLVLPTTIVLRLFHPGVAVLDVLSALLFPLFLLGPTIWFGGGYLHGALDSLRDAPQPPPTDASSGEAP